MTLHRASKLVPTLAVALSLVGAATARAAELGYGGRVVDETGAPLAGPVDVTLRFFDAPMGGTQLGNALSFKAVALVDGNFQLTLGLSDAQQSDIFGDGSHTVYVEVEAATKVYPRQKFLAVPVALRVPVDNATLEFSSDSRLTIKQVSMSQVAGLSDALAANSSTTAASPTESGYLSAADWSRFDAKQAPIDETMTVNAGGLTTAQQSALLVKPYGTAANETGELRFEERTGGNYVALRAPDAVAADLVYTLPGADGAPGQFLSTNGSAMLAWASPAGGGDMIAAANLSDLADSAAARSNLGLGALATASAVGSAQITDGTIANADIAGTAAIATSKLSGAVTSISGHGLGSLATLSSVGSTEITNGAIADADVSGTAAIATSKLSGAVTSISGHGLGSLASASAVGSAEITDGAVSSTDIADGTITNADISASAAIATSKLSGALTSISGHGLGSLAAMSSVSAAEITDGTIADADISGTAAIATSKLSGPLTAVSGHSLGALATLSAVSTTEITDGTIANADISGTAAIDASKIAGGSVSSTEFQYLDGVTSSVQTQLDAKASAASPIFTGAISSALGSAAAPSYSFSGDSNTGIWSSGADTVNVSTAGSERLTVTSTGNVGIGTTVPGQKLSVAGTVESTSGGFKFPDGTTQTTAASAGQWTASGSDVYRSSGNVGIGTTSAAQRLSVYGGGGAPATSGTTQNGTLRLQPTGANNVLDFGLYILPPYGAWLQNTNALDLSLSYPIVLQPNGGNVGIGTTSPSNKLHVVGGAFVDSLSVRSTMSGSYPGLISVTDDSPLAAGTGGGIQFSGIYTAGGSASGAASIRAVKDNATDGDYAFGLALSTRAYPSTSYGERLRITSNGNVGIGTTSPSARLNVAGQIVSNQTVVASGATVDFATGNVQILQSVGGTAITLNNMVDGGAYTLIVSDSTSRTYTFTNCTNTHFTPANAATTASTRTIYSILKTTESAATHCYVSWISGL